MMNGKLQKTLHNKHGGIKSKKKYNLYTSSEAARKLGVTATTIRRYIEQGMLEAVEIASGDLVLIEGSGVDRLGKQFEIEPPKRGRKPKAN